MTSQKYLNDASKLKDFLRSLKEIIPFSVIAFLVLFFEFSLPTINYVVTMKSRAETSQWLKTAKIISFFGTESVDHAGPNSIMTIGMVMCGMLMAFVLFFFALKKERVNVYFSLGITRTRLFINRVLAAVCGLFAATFLPIFIAFLINVITFGFHIHQLALLTYLTMSLFLSGVAGLSIGIFAATVSGSWFEMAVTTFTTSLTLPTLYSLIDFAKVVILKGYYDYYITRDSISSLLSPWTFVRNIGVSNEYDNEYVCTIDYLAQLIIGDKVPNSLKITSGMIIPLVVWAVVSCAMLAIGLYLFKKRKAENSNSFGKFYISAAINGSFAFAIVAAVASTAALGLYDLTHKALLGIVVFIPITFIGFFLAELIIRRKIIETLKTLPVYGGLLLVSMIAILFLGTQCFGTYNKLPDISEVEFVSMSYSDPFNTFSYDSAVSLGANQNREIACKTSDPDDIKLCYEYFSKVRDDKYQSNVDSSTISFVIKTKDGKTMVRSFDVYSEELVHEYNKSVFDSKYFKQIAAYKLINEQESDYDYSYEQYVFDYNYVSFNDILYFNDRLIASGVRAGYGTDEDMKISVDMEFKQALYNDIINISYDDYYCAKEKPFGAISTSGKVSLLTTSEYRFEYNSLHISDVNEYDYESDEKLGIALPSSNIIVIYPQMTETVALLGDLEPLECTSKPVSAYVADKKFGFADAIIAMSKKNVMMNFYSTDRFVRSYMSFEEYDVVYSVYFDDNLEIPETGKGIELIENVYKYSNVKLNVLNDPQQLQKIEDASYVMYDTYNDDGRYVYIIYDDGTIVGRYLPEAKLSVLN